MSNINREEIKAEYPKYIKQISLHITKAYPGLKREEIDEVALDIIIEWAEKIREGKLPGFTPYYLNEESYKKYINNYLKRIGADEIH